MASEKVIEAIDKVVEQIPEADEFELPIIERKLQVLSSLIPPPMVEGVGSFLDPRYSHN